MDKLNRKDLILYLHASAVFQLLHAGVVLGLFNMLHQRRFADLKIIAKLLNLKRHQARSFVFGLTSLGLILKSGNLYRNSQIIERLFSNKEWGLFRAMIKIQAEIMYVGQTDYVASLKAGRNVGVRRFGRSGRTIYQRLVGNSSLTKIFNEYMDLYSSFAVSCLLRQVDFTKDKQILDVGGGSGVNAAALTKKYPHLHVSLFDLPQVISKIRNLQSRIKLHAGDMFKIKFPANQDSVLFIHQLVIWSLEENELLLRKAYRSLKKGGRVIIFSSIAEDSEDGPLMAALDSAYFLSVAAGNGMIYPWKDYKQLLKKVGFKGIEYKRCRTWTPHGIVIGYKN